jgi:hypothetical protein
MNLTPDERRRKIESYAAGFDELMQVLDEIPKAMWMFKPSPVDWSIHEVIIHLADSESNSMVRFRRPVAEPGSSVMAYDQDAWTDSLYYALQSTDTALATLKAVRQSTSEMLRLFPESVWSNVIQHPENGTMTLDDVLLLYEAHIPGHIRQIRENYDRWLAQQSAKGA